MENKKAYENEHIIVYWNSDICKHSGNCVRGDSEVFNPNRRPWIELKEDSGEDISKIIDTCPSGALSYKLK